MSAPVDLYNTSYGNYAVDVYREVRLATYGEDFGQTSWVSTDESGSIPRLLRLNRDSRVLEIGCGSGAYAVHVAAQEGCRITGVDVNAAGIENAARLAHARGLVSLVHFQCCDVARRLPFNQADFDAVYANDVLCHILDRRAVLREVFRVLKPGGHFLFSDALVIAGAIANSELATRSSIGQYVFVPVGENEKLLAEAGFQEISSTDTTGNAAGIARRWRDARRQRQSDLVAMEGEANYRGLQDFLNCVDLLCTERRLLRMLYLARKPLS